MHFVPDFNKQNISQKRPRGGGYIDTMIPQQSKKPRASNSSHQFSLTDQEALERVAQMLNRPVSALMVEASQTYEGPARKDPIDVPQTIDADQSSGFHTRTGLSSQDTTNHWHYGLNKSEVELASPFVLPGPWNRMSGTFRNEGTSHEISYTDTSHNTSHIQIGDGSYAEAFDSFDLDATHTRNLLNDVVLDEADNGFEVEFINQSHFQDGLNYERNYLLPASSTRRNQHDRNLDIEVQDYHLSTGTPFHGQVIDPTEPTLNNLTFSSSSDDLADSDESDLRWEIEDTTRHQATNPSTEQLASSTDTNSSGWSLIEIAKEHDALDNKSSKAKNTDSAFIQWIDPASKQSSHKKRRGPFQDKQLQEETSETRKRKACVRCRQQKTRVSATGAQLHSLSTNRNT
jgi:hypothetical protein